MYVVIYQEISTIILDPLCGGGGVVEASFGVATVLVVKYDSSGCYQTHVRWDNSPANSNFTNIFSVSSIAVDQSSNEVYVCGTVAFDTDGRINIGSFPLPTDPCWYCQSDAYFSFAVKMDDTLIIQWASIWGGPSYLSGALEAGCNDLAVSASTLYAVGSFVDLPGTYCSRCWLKHADQL